MAGKNRDSHWIPLADLMTALMVIFLFIAVAYMEEVKKEKEQQEKETWSASEFQRQR